jgi:hypothetical protein
MPDDTTADTGATDTTTGDTTDAANGSTKGTKDLLEFLIGDGK